MPLFTLGCNPYFEGDCCNNVGSAGYSLQDYSIRPQSTLLTISSHSVLILMRFFQVCFVIILCLFKLNCCYGNVFGIKLSYICYIPRFSKAAIVLSLFSLSVCFCCSFVRCYYSGNVSCKVWMQYFFSLAYTNHTT